MEGMRPDILLESLRQAGATIEGEGTAPQKAAAITKQDFCDWGLSGGPDSGEKRKELLKILDFPERMSANALLQAVNLLYTREELEEIIGK